jgi:hypothetical protein
VKFFMEIELNICHNFGIGTFTKGQPFSNKN